MSDKIRSILDILESRNFSKLIGMEEDLHFEAKGKNPYDFDNPDDRYELAKDVSAFANSDGGIIIIGLIHKKIVDKKTERIDGIELLYRKEIDLDKYKGILVENIYPKMIGLKLKWINDLIDTEKGIAYIYVPKQDQNKRYFLIKNLIEANKNIKGIVFGIAQRIESSNQPLSIDQLHQKIQYGINSTAEKLFRIEEKIDLLNENSLKESTESPVAKINERINRIIEKKE